MAYQLNRERDLTFELVLVLRDFMGTDELDTTLHDAGIDMSALEDLFDGSSGSMTVAFQYEDVEVEIEDGQEVRLKKIQSI